MSVSRVVNVIELNKSQKEKINAAVLAAFPKEMCGVITSDDFIQISNINSDPENSFTMQPKEYAGVVERAIAIVHSHVKQPDTRINIDPRTPSVKDLNYQKASALPWLIVATEGLTVTPPVQFPRDPSSKYEGRNFIWYINDCFTIVQDYYRYQLDIILPANEFDAFNDSISEVIEWYAYEHGFDDVKKIDDIKNGDIVILDSLGQKQNHLGVYHDEKILHQMQVSRFDPFQNYLGRINRILRYGS